MDMMLEGAEGVIAMPCSLVLTLLSLSLFASPLNGWIVDNWPDSNVENIDVDENDEGGSAEEDEDEEDDDDEEEEEGSWWVWRESGVEWEGREETGPSSSTMEGWGPFQVAICSLSVSVCASLWASVNDGGQTCCMCVFERERLRRSVGSESRWRREVGEERAWQCCLDATALLNGNVGEGNERRDDEGKRKTDTKEKKKSNAMETAKKKEDGGVDDGQDTQHNATQYTILSRSVSWG